MPLPRPASAVPTLFLLVACQTRQDPPPASVDSAGPGPAHVDTGSGSLRTDLFRDAPDAETAWKAFLAALPRARTEREMAELVASLEPVLPLDDTTSPWADRVATFARSSTDTRLRACFTRLCFGWSALRTGEAGVRSPQRMGDPPFLSIEGDYARARVQRTRMRLDASMVLVPTDTVDTIEVSHDDYGDVVSSRPFPAGLWRLTQLGKARFRDDLVNIPAFEPVILAAGQDLVVWAPQGARVLVATDSAWEALAPGKDGIHRKTWTPTHLEDRIPVAVEWNGRWVFTDFSVGEDREEFVRAHAWTDRKEYRPGETVHLTGIATRIDAMGWPHPSARRSDSVRLDLSSLGGGNVPLQLDRHGRFSTSIAIPQDASPGFRSLPILAWKPVDSGRHGYWVESHNIHTGDLGFEVATEPTSTGANEPSIELCLESDGRRRGDSIHLAAMVRDARGRPVRGQPVEFRLDSGGQSRTSRANGAGVARTSLALAGDRHGIVFARAVVSGVPLEQGRGVSARPSSPRIPRDSLLHLSLDRSTVVVGDSVRIVVRSRIEGAPVLVQTQGRLLGPGVAGTITRGVFRTTLPVVDLGLGWSVRAFVRGPDSVVRTWFTPLSEGTSGKANLETVVRRDGPTVHLEFTARDGRGRTLPTRLSVAVAGSPSASSFDSLLSDLPQDPGGRMPRWWDPPSVGDVPANRIEGWRTRASIRLAWWGYPPEGVSERRRQGARRVWKTRPPARSVKEGPDRPCEFPETDSVPLARRQRTAFWTDQATSGFFGGPASASFRLPPGDQPWTLVVRGTAGDHLFVSDRRPLLP